MSTPATENLAALLDRLTDNLNILAAAVKRDDEVIRRLYAERDALRKALARVKTEALSLADAQVIALEALKGDEP